MPEPPVLKPPPPHRNYTLYFMAFMLLGVIVTFVSFTFVARQSKAQRREISRANLVAMHQALKEFASTQGAGVFPETLQALHPAFIKDAAVFFHPAWPGRPGYVYVAGARSSDPPETIVIYENIPAGKEKLGRQALSLNGEVHMWTETEFQQKLSIQEAAWKSQGRNWQLVASDASALRSN